jgi:RNA polymerase sigma factor (sigma-70 family)
MAEPRGDRALAELVRTKAGDLTAYACMLTGDRSSGQDLMQEAIIKVFTKTRTGFVPDVAEAYVRRTMLTLYIDGFRRRRSWAAVCHLVATDEQRTTDHESAITDRIDLRVALHALSPQERAVIVLRFYEDLPVADIAERMRLNPGTVKRYLSNGLHKLEDHLGSMPELHNEVETLPVLNEPTTTSNPTGRRP